MSGCLSVSRGFATTLPDVHSAYIQTSFGYLLAWVKGEEATWRDPIVAVGESGAAKSGETLSIWTENLDGDGTVYYFISVRLTEYDE